MERYKGHPVCGSAIPLMGRDGWYAQGLVFAPTETESPIIEIKRLDDRELTFATKEEAEQHALEMCVVWIDEYRKQIRAR
jgi:hypothetical protein